MRFEMIEESENRKLGSKDSKLKEMAIWLFLALILTFIHNFVYGQDTFYSHGSGDFDNVTLWNTSETTILVSGRPNNGDFQNGSNTFIIREGHVLILTSRIGAVNIIVYGTLIFDDDRFEVFNVTITETATIDFNGFFIDTSSINLTVEEGANFVNYVVDENGNVLSGFSTLPLLNPLPIELKYFETKSEKNNVFIKWKTSTEINNYKFKLFRNEKLIYEIRGKGTSYTTNEYFYRDIVPADGVYIYHLKQIDYDSKSESFYSEVTVSGAKKIEDDISINVYPNPSEYFIVVDIFTKRPAELEITDLNGRVIYKNNIINEQYHSSIFQLRGLSHGIYFVKIQSNDAIKVIKFLKKKR